MTETEDTPPGRVAWAQFARFCVVGTSNAVIDFGVLNAALAIWPTRSPLLVLCYNTLAVLLAASNSFVWNRRFTFGVRGAVRRDEVARFAVLAAGTAGLNDATLSALSLAFPRLMASGLWGANALKVGAIIGAMSLSFFGMRLWVFLTRVPPARSAPDIAEQDTHVLAAVRVPAPPM